MHLVIDHRRSFDRRSRQPQSRGGRFRDECLNQHWFASLEEARQVIEAWRIDYNTERPHRALGQETPAAWMTARERRWEAPG